MFTNHKGINPNTRAEVFSLAAKLGYQYLQPRSVAAKGSPKSRSIGVLICSDTEEFNHSGHESSGAELLPGVSEFAQIHHWHTEVHFVSPGAASLADPTYSSLTSLKKRLWSGLLLMSSFPPQVVGELTTRFPCVSLLQHYGNAPVDCVDVDHAKGIAALIDRLRQMRHTRIGFFSRQFSANAVGSNRRFGAFVESLSRLGGAYRERDVVLIDTTSPRTIDDSYQRVVEQIRDGVTAWICAADQLAYDLIRALKERGFAVPGDVSVTGFDGMARPDGAPALDTVCVPHYEIGFAASRRLFDKINKRYEAPQEILIEGRVVPGETIGPCQDPQRDGH